MRQANNRVIRAIRYYYSQYYEYLFGEIRREFNHRSCDGYWFLYTIPFRLLLARKLIYVLSLTASINISHGPIICIHRTIENKCIQYSLPHRNPQHIVSINLCENKSSTKNLFTFKLHGVFVLYFPLCLSIKCP